MRNPENPLIGYAVFESDVARYVVIVESDFRELLRIAGYHYQVSDGSSPLTLSQALANIATDCRTTRQ